YASFSGGSGKFVIDNVMPADYQVQVTDLPAGTFVKSMRFGSIDLLNGSLRVQPRNADRLSITLSANGGAVEGIVTNKNGQTLANAPVALVPDASRRQRADLYRSASTNESGGFHLDGIAPGDYGVFAWEDIEDGLWRDPDFIRRNEAAGKIIHILEG